MPANAGTTGQLAGTVVDDTGAPVAGVTVVASSPSEIEATKTDSRGHYSFLSLSPDMYTITIRDDRHLYATSPLTGVGVFADVQQITNVRAHREGLRTIATVRSRASTNLVNQGQTADVYSVNPAEQRAAQVLGGGHQLNTVYSALASVPGIVLQTGTTNQPYVGGQVYVRGENNQYGFELDGVPITNMELGGGNATTSLSNLGTQQVQASMSGGAATAATMNGGAFINQVIKTGTHPGFGDANLGVGTPTFYHQVKLEAGGATPDRLFSYYAGFLGYNQGYRVLDQFNGAGTYPFALEDSGFGHNFFPSGVYPRCVNGQDPFTLAPGTPGALPAPPGGDPGCATSTYSAYMAPALTADRESIVNLHFGIPHKHDANRDDVQLLFDSSLTNTSYNSSVNDAGGLNTIYNQFPGFPPGLASQIFIPQWADAAVFGNATFGETYNPSITLTPYAFPNSPANRCLNLTEPGIANECPAGSPSLIPFDLRDTQQTDSSTVKLQYQKNMNHSYVRVFGYMHYNDQFWQGAAAAAGLPTVGSAPFPVSDTRMHESGGTIQYVNQLSAKNLFTATANYAQTAIADFEDLTPFSSAFSNATSLVDGNGNCIAYKNVTAGQLNYVGVPSSTVVYAKGQPAPCTPLNYESAFGPSSISISNGTFSNPTRSGVAVPGANWIVTNTGASGIFSGVKPIQKSFAVSDEWRPNDKLVLNGGLRFDSVRYDLPPASVSDRFWYTAAQNDYCYDTRDNAPVLSPIPPSSKNPNASPPLFIGLNCAYSGDPYAVHPDGKNGHLLFTADSPPYYQHQYAEPRLSFTYTLNPDSVLRGSYGLYIQPQGGQTVEYVSVGGGGSVYSPEYFNFSSGFQYGFLSPAKDIQPAEIHNIDLTYEHHVKGTGISYSLTPWVRSEFSYPIIPGYGTEKAFGLELALNAGDPDIDRWSGHLAYTYERAYQYLPVLNGVIPVVASANTAIGQYNALTKAGGGQPCYLSGAAYAGCTVNGNSIAVDNTGLQSGAVINPYYFNTPQPLVGSSYFANQQIPPNELTGFLNYHSGRLNITPSFQLEQGARYGNLYDVRGYNPVGCTQNSSGLGSNPAIPSATNSGQANYTSCNTSPGGASPFLYIPDPTTGKFDNLNFTSPWQLNISAQIRYDLSSKVSANLILSNLFNRCFGGSKTPWSQAFPPNSTTCTYFQNFNYISNYYNGSGPLDTAANGGVPGDPSAIYPYTVDRTPLYPFNAYLNFSFKL